MKAFPLAFPLVSKEPYQYDWGMDLRDYFAKEAMCLQTWFTDTDNEYAAKRCYEIADAMMKAREVK